MAHNPKRSQLRPFFVLASIPIFLTLIGIFFVFEASSVRALQSYGDSLWFMRRQVIWAVLGIITMVLVASVPLEKLKRIIVPMLVATIVALVAVKFTDPINGASRWFTFGGFSIQPTEFTKLITILYLAAWFEKKEEKRFIPFVVFMATIVGLVMWQPDLGTAIVLAAISMVMFLLAGKELLWLFTFLPIAVVGVGIFIANSAYRMNRVLAFFNPALDPDGKTYHINQIFISLSSGGFFGTGLGLSRQKYLFLPEAHTDSIFAIIGEEIGFFGCVFIILLYAILVLQLYRVYIRCHGRFTKLMVGGVFAFFSFQTIINLGSMVGLLPLTGVPLPFLSYGGSSLIVSYAAIGMAMSALRTQHSA